VSSENYSAQEYYAYNGGSGLDIEFPEARPLEGLGQDDYCGLTRVRGLLAEDSFGGLLDLGGRVWMIYLDSNSGPLQVGARCVYHEFNVP